MQTPFPGMDPYLEHPELWHDVHQRLIVVLANELAPIVRPRYRVVVEKHTYMLESTELLGVPDLAALRVTREAALAYEVGIRPRVVQVPMPEEISEGFLEVRDVVSGEVITVIEILSSINKRPGRDRRHYVRKRLDILGSLTNFVEIDLLRAYKPMPVHGDGQDSHYRILVSRSERRPRADLYCFTVRDTIPTFMLPLQHDDTEPAVDLNHLLHDLYDRAGYDLSIDYFRDPVPPFEGGDAAWVAERLAPLRERSGS